MAVKESKSFRELIVKELTDKFKKSPTLIFSSFSGLKSKELEGLRRNLKSSSSEYMVVKNTLTKRALKKAKLEDFAGLINGSEGSAGIAFTKDDAISCTKSMVKFEKETETFKIQGALFEGEKISLDRLKEIAALLSKEELLAKIVGGLHSPIYGIVFVLKENLRKVTSLLSEISKKKG